jgi:hypothetical protein
MTGRDDFDRALAGWFEADALAPAPAGALERILDVTRRRRPRSAWLAWLGSNWVGEAPHAGSSAGARSLPRLNRRRSTVLVLVLVIAALVGGAILVGALLLQPSPLPAGHLGHLAYGLDDGIYVADWDGRNPVRIASKPPEDPTDCLGVWGEGQIWAPDGRHLAYRSGMSSCGTVAIRDPAGHVVAAFPGTGWLVSWSPDSTRVATWVELPKTIGIYGLDGVRQALLTLPPGREPHGDFDPGWSPDGASLLISLGPLLPEAGGSQVWELPVDGRPPRVVPTSDPRSHFDAVYSRDGSRMAFISWTDAPSLVISRADGTELRVLAGAVNGPNETGHGAAYQHPVVSDTGDLIAFIWSPGFYDQTVDPSSKTYELRVVEVATGKVTTLASASGEFPLDPIRFAPEGDRILFSRTEANGVTSLWSVHADGSDAQPLVTGANWGDWQFLPADR